MANKINNNLSIDRESIDAAANLSAAAEKALNGAASTCRTAIKAITADNNLTGGDSKDVIVMLDQFGTCMDTIDKKITTVASALKKLNTSYSGSASVATRSFAEAKEQMNGVLLKMKQAKSN